MMKKGEHTGPAADLLSAAVRAVFPVLPALAAAAITAGILALAASGGGGAAVPAAGTASVLGAFFSGPFASVYYFGNMLNTAALLAFAATGACIAFKSGAFNLGGEGQIYASGFTAAIVLAALERAPPPAGFTAAFLAAAAAGAVMGCVPGLLRAFRGANELLTSFLLSGAVIPVIDYLVSGPFRDQGKNLLATPMLPEALRLRPLLPPSSLSVSFFIALAVTLGGGWFFSAAAGGYRMRISGTAPEFALVSGLSPRRFSAAGMTLSGLFHGMTGFFAVTGTYYTCHLDFYSGMGWNALAAALIAGSQPYAVFPAALLIGYLTTAAERSVLNGGFSADAAGIIQAAVFLFISVGSVSVYRRGRKG